MTWDSYHYKHAGYVAALCLGTWAILASVVPLDVLAQQTPFRAGAQGSPHLELTEAARARIAETIAAYRLAKREAGAAPAKSHAEQLAMAETKTRLMAGAVAVLYTNTYFDTQAGDDFSFPEDAHDFCRVGFDATARQDYTMDAFISAGATLMVQLDWTGAADFDLYLFDRNGRTVGDPNGLFPEGFNGIEYQQSGDPLTEIASAVNAPGDDSLLAVVDRFRGDASSHLTLTFTGNEGAYDVLEYVDIDTFMHLDANTDDTLGVLTDGVVINLDQLGSPRPNFNVLLQTDGCAESYGFVLIDAATELPVREFTDNEPPYALFGDVNGDYNPGDLADGAYRLTATPFSEDDAGGVAGAPTTVSFTILNDPVISDTARVVSFSLIDAAVDQPIPGFDPIAEGSVIDLVALFQQGIDINRLNIEANTVDPLGLIAAVDFGLELIRVSGTVETPTSSDTGAPYSVYGDDNAGDFSDASLAIGAYTLSGTPVGMSGADPGLFVGASVTFRVIGPRISNYTLIDADLNDPIPEFDPILPGATIDFSTLAAQNFNIRANTIDYDPPLIDAVAFVLYRDGAVIFQRTESYRPYAVFGDCNQSIGCTVDIDPPYPDNASKPNYLPWTNPVNGNHLIVGSVYDGNPTVPTSELLSVDSLHFILIGAGTPPPMSAPRDVQLLANFPNPFNPVTTIRFGIPEAVPVRLIVYDMLGREIKVLVDSPMPSGFHEVSFDAGNLSSGLYLYRLETPGGAQVRPMTLLK